MPTLSALKDKAISTFRAAFGGLPELLARAPGRVELLGNHTDYNEGHVLAATIDRFTVVAGRHVAERSARFRSVDFDQEECFDLGTITPGVEGSWGRYVRGVVWALQEARGPFSNGFEAVIAGNVPLGAGLSSSASLQASLARFLLGPDLAFDDDERMTLARQLQRSENAFVGVASGLLDQFSVLFGKEGHALTLDCRTFDYARVPLEAAIVVCDSKTSRKLADGMYNLRRTECERVAEFFRVGSLRDVTLEAIHANWDALDPIGRLRARHVLTENDRVLRGAKALKSGNLHEFGRLMSASHASSRDDFANSSPALDLLIEAAERAPGFLGGKLSGAGWAGCTVNLVEPASAQAFGEAVSTAYTRSSGVVPEVHICKAAEGAEVVRGSW